MKLDAFDTKAMERTTRESSKRSRNWQNLGYSLSEKAYQTLGTECPNWAVYTAPVTFQDLSGNPKAACLVVISGPSDTCAVGYGHETQAYNCVAGKTPNCVWSFLDFSLPLMLCWLREAHIRHCGNRADFHFFRERSALDIYDLRPGRAPDSLREC